jgi:hypothetical protein
MWNVRALDAELDDVKALLELPHSDQGLANRVKHVRLAQGSDRCMGAHDDVSRPVRARPYLAPAPPTASALAVASASSRAIASRVSRALEHELAVERCSGGNLIANQVDAIP